MILVAYGTGTGEQPPRVQPEIATLGYLGRQAPEANLLLTTDIRGRVSIVPSPSMSSTTLSSGMIGNGNKDFLGLEKLGRTSPTSLRSERCLAGLGQTDY